MVIVNLEFAAIVLLTFIVASTVLALLAVGVSDNKTAPNESVAAAPSVAVVAVVPTKPNDEFLLSLLLFISTFPAVALAVTVTEPLTPASLAALLSNVSKSEANDLVCASVIPDKSTEYFAKKSLASPLDQSISNELPSISKVSVIAEPANPAKDFFIDCDVIVVALNVEILAPVSLAPVDVADLLPSEPSSNFIVLNSVVSEILVNSL